MNKWIARGAMIYCILGILGGGWIYLPFAWIFMNMSRTFLYLEMINER